MVRTKDDPKKINKSKIRTFSSKSASQSKISSSSNCSSPCATPPSTSCCSSSSTSTNISTIFTSSDSLDNDSNIPSPSNPKTQHFTNEKSTVSYIKHWREMIHNCVDWMKNKIIFTLDLVLYQNINAAIEYDTTIAAAGPANSSKSSALEFQSPSPFHLLPIDILAGTLIRFIPMADVASLKLCSHACCELFELAARNSSLLLLHCRPIHVGPYTNRCQYSLPSPHNPTAAYLPILWTLRHFISLISKQTQTINYEYMSSHQSISILGPLQYLDEQMRSSVIDWMIEVSVEYKFVPSILHYSVLLLDQVLSHVSIPRRSFQLLGCSCLYLVSRPTNSTIQMDLDDVMYMCDSQYTLEEVNAMIAFLERHLDAHSHRLLVASVTQQTQIPISSLLSSSAPTPLPFPMSTPMPSPLSSSSASSSSFSDFNEDPNQASSSPSSPFPIYSPELTLPSFKITLNSPTMIHFLASICNALHLPLVMYQCIEINSSIYNNPTAPVSSEPNPTPSTAEHILLSIFLADLSLLDYQMLQYSPFTLACAVTCLTRLTLFYYAQSQVLLTPYGLADGKSREIKQLLGYHIPPPPPYLNQHSSVCLSSASLSP
jgi:hypothetical protein